MKYSSTTGNFYPSDIDYRTVPDDAQEVTLETFQAAMDRPQNKKFDIVEGNLVLTDIPPAPFAPQRDAYLATVRATRELILNRLAGIGLAAMFSGDSATSTAVQAARTALLGLTDSPGIAAATNLDALKAAVLAVYREIVSAAPAGLKKSFDGVSA